MGDHILLVSMVFDQLSIGLEVVYFVDWECGWKWIKLKGSEKCIKNPKIKLPKRVLLRICSTE